MSPRRPSAFAIASAFLLLAVFGPACVTPALHAATTEHDLQQGLAYLRATELTPDLAVIEKQFAAHASLILDLRHTAADDDSAAALGRLLARSPATPHLARFILISESTSPALLKQLAIDLPGTVTLAAQTKNLHPDIAVSTTSDEDNLAYDALTSGVSFDKLLSGTTPQKARYDEASLVRDHANGANGRYQPPDEPELEPANSEQSDTPPAAAIEKPAPQPVDRVLLRAVQLHRALLALKKL